MYVELKEGDRVEGVSGSHKGKKGTVLVTPKVPALWVELKWDGGKRKSTVQKYYLQKINE